MIPPAELRERYAEPHRRYHTREHIEDCLAAARANLIRELAGPTG